MTESLLEHLGAGNTLITPNNRLSAILLEDYYKAHGAKPLKKPACLPWRSFLVNTYKQFVQGNDAANHPLLLTDLQCQYLWRELLQAHPEITWSEGLSSAVMDAWNNCELWQISPEHPAFNYTAQTAQFQIWQQLFHEKLQQLQAITENQILSYLIDFKVPFLKNTVIWTCFDSFTPQQESLQTWLTEQGIEQVFYELPEKNAECYQFAAQHAEDEREQLLHFLKQRLDLNEKRIAVVVPDLQQQAALLQRYLARKINPELFNISLGKTLRDYPLVAHAIQWLAFNDKAIDNAQARLLLLSPYLAGSQSELHARVQCMQDNPLLQKNRLDFKTWIHALKNAAPVLAKALESIKPYPQKASPKAWVDHFKARLEILGFPGEYGLESENYQCFSSFMELLANFAQLELFTPSMHQKQALQALKDMAAKTIFQAQTTDKPIQILGLLEAAGCQFDSLWVMGLTDHCLPEKTRLSPFIPHELQRSKNMPHSVPARELQLARQLLQRLQRGCNFGLFSYSLLSADSPNLPSPLIKNLPQYSPITPKNASVRALIPFTEDYQYPLRDQETVSGGTALLANQAKCPFKAFAAHRLHAKRAPEVYDGLNALDRGQLIHKIMETLWRNLANQQALLALSESVLNSRIEEAIIAALSPYALMEFIQEIELKRLKRLVLACLDWEKQRPAFRVEHLEATCSLQLNALNIQMRVDRIDATADGKKWIIDYKTSIPANKPWNEERPQEPQLLLYALLDESINTLLFLALKTGKLNIAGFSEDKLNIRGVTNPKGNSWSEQRNFWQQQLHNLADEFSQGQCAPQPVNPLVCMHCDFQNLCRFRSV